MTIYLRAAWYAAALGRELSSGGAIGRVLLGDRIALYRGAAGDPVALFDRCPHRFAQLHLGEVMGEEIQCPYHGLRFDARGACTHNPHGNGAIPARASVRSSNATAQSGSGWVTGMRRIRR